MEAVMIQATKHAWPWLTIAERIILVALYPIFALAWLWLWVLVGVYRWMRP